MDALFAIVVALGPSWPERLVDNLPGAIQVGRSLGFDIAESARRLGSALNLDLSCVTLSTPTAVDLAYARVHRALQRRPTDEAEVRAALATLRSVQQEEASRMDAHFREHHPFDPEVAQQSLQRARDLLGDA